MFQNVSVTAIALITVFLIAHVLNLKGNTNEKVPIIFAFLFFKWLLSKLQYESGF